MKKLFLKTNLNSIESKSTKNGMVVGYLTPTGFVVQNLEIPGGTIAYDKDSGEMVMRVKMAMGDYLIAMDAEGLVESKTI